MSNSVSHPKTGSRVGTWHPKIISRSGGPSRGGRKRSALDHENVPTFKGIIPNLEELVQSNPCLFQWPCQDPELAWHVSTMFLAIFCGKIPSNFGLRPYTWQVPPVQVPEMATVFWLKKMRMFRGRPKRTTNRIAVCLSF